MRQKDDLGSSTGGELRVRRWRKPLPLGAQTRSSTGPRENPEPSSLVTPGSLLYLSAVIRTCSGKNLPCVEMSEK